MSDTITLHIKLPPEDVAKIEATLAKLGVKPLQIKPPKSEDTKAAEGTVARLRQQMKGLEKDIEGLSNVKSIRAKQAELQSLEKQLDGMLGKKNGFASLLPSVTALAPAVAVGGLIGVALKRGVDNAIALDKEVRNIGSLGIKNFEEFGDKALEISRSVPDSAASIARGAYDAISAGIDPKRAGQFVEIAAKTGVAGLSDTGTAVNALTSILNAYKLSADQTEKVSDIMFTTVNLGKVTFEELNASIANVVPTAASVNVGFDQVGGAIATMTKQGVPAQQASTKLNQAMVELQKPGKELEGLLKRAGIESGTMALKTTGLQGTLAKLGEQADREGKTLTQYFGSVDAGSAALLLTGENAKMAADDLSAMKNAAGAMGNAFEVNAGSAENQMKLLQNNIDAVSTQAVQSLGPAFNAALEMVTGAFAQINEWLESAEQRMARLKREADEDRGKDIAAVQQHTRERMANLNVQTLAELDALKKMDRAELEQFYKRKGLLAKTKTMSDDTYKQIRQNLFGTGSDVIRKEYGAMADEIIAGLNEVPKAVNKAQATAAGDADKIREARLKKELADIEQKMDLELLRAQKEGDSEKTLLGIKEFYLEQKLGAQRRFGAKQEELDKTLHDLARNRIEQEYAGTKKLVEGSLEWFEEQIKKIKDRLQKAKIGSALYDDLRKQQAEAEAHVKRIKEAYDRQIKLMQDGKEISQYTAPELPGMEDVAAKVADDIKKEMDARAEKFSALGNEIGMGLSDGIAAALDFSESEESFTEFGRAMLAIAVDFALRELAISAALAWAKELATKGLLGIITGGIVSGLVLGLSSKIKSSISGFASGGVIVGEGGQPEIIAPAREFSEFAGTIVTNALAMMQQAALAMQRAERNAAVAGVAGQYTFAPAEVVFRGDRAVAFLRVQSYRDQVGSLGM